MRIITINRRVTAHIKNFLCHENMSGVAGWKIYHEFL